MRHVTPAKTGEYPRIFPNFQNWARCEKDLKDNKDNSRHLGRKYVRIFGLRHYLFLVAHSFLRTSLSENCSLLGADNVRGQISEHIFAPNGDYCLYTSSNQRLRECVRRRINIYTDALNDFPSWLSISKNQPFFINNRGFTERYFSDKVHAILIEEVLVQTTLHDGASFRRPTSLIGL